MIAAVRGKPVQRRLAAMRFLPHSRTTPQDRWPLGPVAVPFDDVDRAVEELARRRGHTVQQTASLSFTLVLTSKDAERVRRTLPIAVERDGLARTYSARVTDPRLSWAWGHGHTIGEAFHDGLDELVSAPSSSWTVAPSSGQRSTRLQD